MTQTTTYTTSRKTTRRRLISTAGATILAPSFIDVATADTDSGHVELQTVADVPTDTTITITAFEDTNDSGNSSRQQSATIPNGTTTTELDLLESSVAQGDELWIQVDLATENEDVTPSLDSATLTLPETPTEPTETPSEPVEGPDDPQGLGALWQNYRAIVAAIVIAYAGIGLWSKSLTLAAWSGYMAFLYIAFTTGTPIFENIALATLVLVFLGFAFKLIRLEFEGDQ